MTEQNLENEATQGQNPVSGQAQQQPPVIPQQSVEPQAQQGTQAPAPAQPVQSRQEPVNGQPQYQGQPQTQGQPQYQGQAQSQYQGQPNYGTGAPISDKPNNYMAMNIAATIIGFLCGGCCIPGIVGIVGIVFSSQVDTKYSQGDLNGALSSASTAKTIGIISLVLSGLCIIGIIIYVVVVLAAVGTDSFMDGYREALDGL